MVDKLFAESLGFDEDKKKGICTSLKDYEDGVKGEDKETLLTSRSEANEDGLEKHAWLQEIKKVNSK